MRESWASSHVARQTMLANRRRDTRPEISVRRLLHSRGLRYRVDVAPAGSRNRADIVFTRCRIAVFIDGCFWHRCPVHGTMPKSNAEYWKAKLDGNAKRDSRVTTELTSSGWTVLRFWEHEHPVSVADAICAEWLAAQSVIRPTDS